MNKCTGIMGRIFGHKFMPCFSLSGGQPMELRGSHRFIEMMMDKSRNKTYHLSVCQRCGEVAAPHKEAPLNDEHPVVEPSVYGCKYYDLPQSLNVKGGDNDEQ